MKNKKFSWIYRGLFFGVGMFVFMGILYPLAERETLNPGNLTKSLVFWLFAGLITQKVVDYIDSRLEGGKGRREKQA